LRFDVCDQVSVFGLDVLPEARGGEGALYRGFSPELPRATWSRQNPGDFPPGARQHRGFSPDAATRHPPSAGTHIHVKTLADFLAEQHFFGQKFDLNLFGLVLQSNTPSNCDNRLANMSQSALFADLWRRNSGK